MTHTVDTPESDDAECCNDPLVVTGRCMECGAAHSEEVIYERAARSANPDSEDRSSERGVRGQPHPQAQLSDEEVRMIRYRTALGSYGIQKQLAEEYDVCESTVSRIVNNVSRTSTDD